MIFTDFPLESCKSKISILEDWLEKFSRAFFISHSLTPRVFPTRQAAKASYKLYFPGIFKFISVPFKRKSVPPKFLSRRNFIPLAEFS